MRMRTLFVLGSTAVLLAAGNYATTTASGAPTNGDRNLKRPNDDIGSMNLANASDGLDSSAPGGHQTDTKRGGQNQVTGDPTSDDVDKGAGDIQQPGSATVINGS